VLLTRGNLTLDTATSAIAHLVCVGLWCVQWQHCRDQLAGVPMRASNYVRACALLVVIAPFVGVVWAVRWAAGMV